MESTTNESHVVIKEIFWHAVISIPSCLSWLARYLGTIEIVLGLSGNHLGENAPWVCCKVTCRFGKHIRKSPQPSETSAKGYRFSKTSPVIVVLSDIAKANRGHQWEGRRGK